MEINIYHELLLLFLIFIQSIIGVGILVLGTPIFLILDFSMIELYFVLLPISILTSLLNLLIFKIKKNQDNLCIGKKVIQKFFFMCVPSVFIGLIVLKNFDHFLNFKIIVAAVILFSIIYTNLIENKNLKIKNIYLIIVGIIHGLTNSGGTLLSIFFSRNKFFENSRYNITFFYFFLALFQFILSIYLFKKINLEFFNLSLILLLIFGVLLANIFLTKINIKIFRFLINLLAFISCLALLISS